MIELSLTGVVVPCYFKGRLKTSNQAQVEAVNTMATVTCSGIVQEQHDRWEKALRHPFLQGCKDGSVAPEAFNTWLLQVPNRVRLILPCQGRVWRLEVATTYLTYNCISPLAHMMLVMVMVMVMVVVHASV